MQAIDSILAVADDFDAIVFDQWGVLHNGTAPYPDAVGAISALHQSSRKLAVLSNSGKSSHVNRDRITSIGFPANAFGPVMTSGEALRLDFASGQLAEINTLYAITSKRGDAETWAADLPLDLTDQLEKADAVLLMGLPDTGPHDAQRGVLEKARAAGKTLICSNPDRASPRGHDKLVESPGALAHEYADAGGAVTFYGKPHRPVFEALAAQLGPANSVLMVGDSPEHDIAGAKGIGWHTLYISGGIHAAAEDQSALFEGIGLPDYILPSLR